MVRNWDSKGTSGLGCLEWASFFNIVGFSLRKGSMSIVAILSLVVSRVMTANESRIVYLLLSKTIK